MAPHITGLYAAPLAVMMIALSTHVTMLRARTGISILDGGNIQLAERIRRHANFAENVPLVLLLMLMAELLGTAALCLHAAGALLLAGRVLHAFGLRHDQPAAWARIAGGAMTTVATLVGTVSILQQFLRA